MQSSFVMQLIMEIPLELMLTISQKLPWMFFPDIIPVGHPIFDIINSTNPEVSVWQLTFFIISLFVYHVYVQVSYSDNLFA